MPDTDIREALVSALCIIAEQEKLLFENQAMIQALSQTFFQEDQHRQEVYKTLFLQEMTGAPAHDSSARADSILVIARKLKN